MLRTLASWSQAQAGLGQLAVALSLDALRVPGMKWLECRLRSVDLDCSGRCPAIIARGRIRTILRSKDRSRFDLEKNVDQVKETMDYLHNLADIGMEPAHGSVAVWIPCI